MKVYRKKKMEEDEDEVRDDTFEIMDYTNASAWEK